MKHRKLFFSRQDDHSIFLLGEIFSGKEGYVWFIEHVQTHEWIQWIKPTISLTKDPRYALSFKTQLEAISYCAVHHLGIEYTQTEHKLDP